MVRHSKEGTVLAVFRAVIGFSRSPHCPQQEQVFVEQVLKKGLETWIGRLPLQSQEETGLRHGINMEQGLEHNLAQGSGESSVLGSILLALSWRRAWSSVLEAVLLASSWSKA
ncbi:uncharacterized [Tachysurus ichikawai]